MWHNDLKHHVYVKYAQTIQFPLQNMPKLYSFHYTGKCHMKKKIDKSQQANVTLTSFYRCSDSKLCVCVWSSSSYYRFRSLSFTLCWLYKHATFPPYSLCSVGRFLASPRYWDNASSILMACLHASMNTSLYFLTWVCNTTEIKIQIHVIILHTGQFYEGTRHMFVEQECPWRSKYCKIWSPTFWPRPP